MEKLPLVLDLMGTFVFALSGALAGVKRALDLFGVLVLSFAAANSGGITRDLLIGVVPPGAVSDWHYLGVSLFAGIITFYCSSLIVRMSNSVLLFDAAGLALFAVTGASVGGPHSLAVAARLPERVTRGRLRRGHRAYRHARFRLAREHGSAARCDSSKHPIREQARVPRTGPTAGR